MARGPSPTPSATLQSGAAALEQQQTENMYDGVFFSQISEFLFHLTKQSSPTGPPCRPQWSGEVHGVKPARVTLCTGGTTLFVAGRLLPTMHKRLVGTYRGEGRAFQGCERRIFQLNVPHWG